MKQQKRFSKLKCISPCLGVFIGALAPRLPAQQAESAGAQRVEAEEQVRFVNLFIYAWPYEGSVNADTVIHQVAPVYFQSLESEERVAVRRQRSTGPYAYPVLGEYVELYERTQGVHPETGEPEWIRTPRIRARIPEGWENLLLVVFPDSRENGLYRTFPMDASSARTPKGMVRLLNGTPDVLGVQAGEDVMVIQPSESVLFKPQLPPGGSRFPVRMMRRQGDEWQLIYSSNQRLEPEKANLMVIYPSGGRRVQVMNFGGIP
ncbi:MAG: hypothetical protein JJU05_07965 [Verrucomicrobia bacterium]|nr:hypothetical protein [Verrucomicrobiota bacterium]MCH8527509.1 hypothetical protein [Kiritimatiellia bacterium]